MPIFPDLGTTDVKDGESPLYTEGSSLPPYMNSSPALAQAAGSNLDSDTVDGIDAVTSSVRGPNKLVATDASGFLPINIIPTGGVTPGILPFISDTYTNLKAGSRPSTVSLCLATDQGVAGVLYLYTSNTSAGDSGFVLIGGS